MSVFISYITEHYIDLIGASIGLLYLYLEYKASIWMWLASIVMAVLFIYIFYSARLYANMVIYIYFFLASIYAWTAWLTKNRNSDTGSHIISRISRKRISHVLIFILGAFIICSTLLYMMTDNSILILTGDALTTSLTVVALWMATHKWAEQWCPLIPANLLSSALLYHQGEIASSIMFFFYFIVSILGYKNWKKMASQNT